MSVRIHELAKRLNMEGKDLLALLKERGYVAADTKSVSSTVSKIYEEILVKEFTPQEPAAAAVAPAPDAPPAADVAPKVRAPAGVFVRSKEEIDRQKEAAKAAAAPAVVRPPVPHAPPAARHAPLPPRPAPPVPASKAPAPASVVSRPASVPAPAASAPPPVRTPVSAP
ncbi:MAG TPA: translation initiation factor IF-2, partial [Opitutaceae bacterium]|nr:translation initiation factor IF-2 [Opitutaceae bacterium]